MLLVFFFWFGTRNTKGQNYSIKTLEEQLNQNLPDSSRIKLLFKLTYSYQNNFNDSCLSKAKQAMKLAIKQENSEFLCDAYNWLGTGYIAMEYPDSAYTCFTNALNCGKEKLSQATIASAINNLGVYYAQNGNPKRALRFYYLSLKIRKENGLTESISSNYNNIGNVKERIGDFPGAIRDFNQSLRYKILFKDTSSISITYSNIAKVYFALNNLEEARKYLKLSWYWSSLTGNLVEKLALCNFEGALAYTENKFEEAAQSFVKGLLLARELKSKQNEIIILSNLSETENTLENYDKAILYGLEGLKIAEETNNAENLITFYLNITLAYLKKNNAKEALKYAQGTMQVLKKHPIEAYQITALEQLAQAYQLNKDFEKALEVYKEYANQKISSNLRNSEDKIKKIELEIENKEQQLKINQLESETEFYNKQLRQNAVIGALLFLIIVVLGISVIQIIKSRKAKIEDHKLISKQAEELKEKAKELQHLNEVKDKMFSILSHDLKSPLVNFQQTLFLLEEGLLEKEELPFVINTLKEKFGNLNLLLENLLNWSKARIREQKEFEPKQVEVYSLVTRSIDLLKHQADSKKIVLNNLVNLDHQVFADLNQMDMIIRNLLTNAIKFSPENSFIEIRSKIESGKIILEFVDQGTGMNQEEIERILHGEIGSSKAGTRGEQGSGLGLSLVKEFIDANKGILEIESTPGKGSCFRISFEAV